MASKRRRLAEETAAPSISERIGQLESPFERLEDMVEQLGARICVLEGAKTTPPEQIGKVCPVGLPKENPPTESPLFGGEQPLDLFIYLFIYSINHQQGFPH